MANSIIGALVPTSLVGLVGTIFTLIAAYNLYYCLYNYLFHKLSSFPGPLLCGISKGPAIYHQCIGDHAEWMSNLHSRYGDVVRFTPGELSFSGADSFRDIYGHKTGSTRTLEKDPRFYKSMPGEAMAITNAPFADHSRMRRIFSNAFSDKSLKLQEPMFLTYVDQLINMVRKGIKENPQRKWNMVRLLNFTTFDIMGELSFAEPLGMLENADYHPWVSTIFEGVRFGVIIHIIRYFPVVEEFLFRNLPAAARKGMEDHRNFTKERVDRRLEKKESRPDIWGLVLKREGDSGLTRSEMYSNANVFMVAGTETTATTLSGLTYLVLKNPETLAKLTHEIRTTFQSEADINIEQMQAMKYVNACLEESLRVYPPVPVGLPRITPAGEPTIIDGKAIPAGSSVMASHLAVYRNPDNFRNPLKFAPERWLSESTEYAGDKKHGFHPFSLGPRGCLGKNMAYHEMRVILVKFLYNFDISLCEESEGWINQKNFILWEKGELMVQIKERAR